MAKEKFDRSKAHVNIGTIGHVDHGKTTLTAAITTVFIYQSKGKLKLWIMLQLMLLLKKKNVELQSTTAHVEYQTATRHYAHVDCPGHADYIKEYDHWGCTNGWCYP